jgi:hypothetical protein
MRQPRAADDFRVIRARLDELERERLSQQPLPPTTGGSVGHRGPCSCGSALFADECDGSCKLM